MQKKFDQLRQMYAAQCDILGIYILEHVSMQYSNQKYTLTISNPLQYKSLVILSSDPLLFKDFSYLAIFDGVRELFLGDKSKLFNEIHLGTNFHTNPSIEKLIVNHRVQSIASDFSLATPQFFRLYFNGRVGRISAKWDFPNLYDLRFGNSMNTSDNGLDWVASAPLIKELKIVNVSAPIKRLTRFAGSLETLSISNCNINEITATEWMHLQKLKTLSLTDMGMTVFPAWLNQLPLLTEINFGNPVPAYHPNDFSKQDIVIDHTLKHLEIIKIRNANVRLLELIGRQDDEDDDLTFQFRVVDVAGGNTDEFHTNLLVNDSQDDYGNMAIDLSNVSVSGKEFPVEILAMASVSLYEGGYVINGAPEQYSYEDLDGNTYDFNWVDVPFAKNGSNVLRDQVYQSLKSANPDMTFYEPSAVLPVVDLTFARPVFQGRVTPYFLRFAPPTTGLQCQICFEEFTESNETLITDNAFVGTNVVTGTRGAVTCNITAIDIKNTHSKTLEFAAYQKLNKRHDDHVFHEDCYQRWLLRAYRENTPTRCPVTHDVFYHN